MKFFAAILRMKDVNLSQELRPRHVEFLDRGGKAGTVYARGRFEDGSGGLVIYRAESLAEAQKIAQSDPYISGGARSLELHEWNMKVSQ